MDTNRITNYMDDGLVDAFTHACRVRELRWLRNDIYEAIEHGASVPPIPDTPLRDPTPSPWPHDHVADLIAAWRREREAAPR